MSSRGFTGSAVKQAALAWIESAGWSVRRGLEILSGESKADQIIGRGC